MDAGNHGGLPSPRASPVTAMTLPCSPRPHYPVLLCPVLFLGDLTERIILHLFARLFPVCLLHGSKCRKHSDHICYLPVWPSSYISFWHTLPSQYLWNIWTNEFCGCLSYAPVNNNKNKLDDMKGKGRERSQKKMLIPPFFLKTLALRLVSED